MTETIDKNNVKVKKESIFDVIKRNFTNEDNRHLRLDIKTIVEGKNYRLNWWLIDQKEDGRCVIGTNKIVRSKMIHVKFEEGEYIFTDISNGPGRKPPVTDECNSSLLKAKLFQ